MISLQLLQELQPEADRSAVNEFAGKMMGVSEFLAELAPVPPSGRVDATVAYQDACHLQHAADS